MTLPDGLYDALISESLALGLSTLQRGSRFSNEPLTSAEAADRLVDFLSRELALLLERIPGGSGEKLKLQIGLLNGLLTEAHRLAGVVQSDPDSIPQAPAVLRAIHGAEAPPSWPSTGLRTPALFTAGKDSPSLLAELRTELASCDQVDMLVSFIKQAGVRKMLDILRNVTAVGADGKPRTRIRVLTTTYTGATDQSALDLLAGLPGCEVKVSLDGRRTRLHAKAWIFHRRTGFGSAYVGSANLSGAALMGGLEWTVKLTQRGDEPLFEQAKAHFETLWSDPEFQSYDPASSLHREALSQALAREAGDVLIAQPGFFDIEPKTYQRDMLDQLALEREHGRTRNLVVSATGTGKTVVAAFDYRREAAGRGHPRLLFVAHREEILAQALRTYREVLRDHSFGELLAGGHTPMSYDHVFATIDSVTAHRLIDRFGPGYWDTVVIDECHRMAGDRFDRFATSVRPRVLLGLTATPERADGKPILPYFQNRLDGSPAVELRLWDALDLQLLSPFEYYGIDDDTDFTEVPWGRSGEELSSIDRLVTGNDARARLVVQEWQRLTGNAGTSRALVFCVSVAHAEYMTRKFIEAGLPALCVTGTTPASERRQAPGKLRKGEVCALVTVDLFNEGVDLPEADTLLLLRPTQSPVVFQQQIGRGLRLAPGKESCLILDFVGRHRAEFRFDHLFTTLTGLTRRELESEVERGFSRLPPGCHIQLGRVAREQVLHSLRTIARRGWSRLRPELLAYASMGKPLRLTEFVRDQGIDIADIYPDREPSGWTALKRAAGLPCPPRATEDDYFGRRIRNLLHTDDPRQVHIMRRVAESSGHYSPTDQEEHDRLQMLAYQIDSTNDRRGSGAAFLERLRESPALLEELGEIGEYLEARESIPYRPLPGASSAAMCLHARYSRREILTAFGWYTAERRPPSQGGALALPDKKTELLFVTLDKSAGFHDRIAYRDHAISPERFHWQSQNVAGPSTMAGRRYIESPDNGWTFQLFVRTRPGGTYVALGSAELESWEGDKPMSIVWRLTAPLSPRLFEQISVLRGA